MPGLLTIRNAQDLEKALYEATESLANGTEVFFDEVHFADEMEFLRIVVVGERYHSTIPTELARGLWQFQESVYRAIALATAGIDDIRRLTDEQRTAFELVFKVGEGSTSFTEPFDNVIDALKEGFQKMSPKQILALSIFIVATIGLTVMHEKHTDASVQIEERLSAERQHAESMQTIREAIKRIPQAAQVSGIIEEGKKAIVRGASDADSITIGSKTYTKPEIDELNARSPRRAAISRTVVDRFRVVRTDNRNLGVTRFGLVRVSDNAEFTAHFIRDEMTMADEAAIWEAAQSLREISLEVIVTLRRNEFVMATIIGVPLREEIRSALNK